MSGKPSKRFENCLHIKTLEMCLNLTKYSKASGNLAECSECLLKNLSDLFSPESACFLLESGESGESANAKPANSEPLSRLVEELTFGRLLKLYKDQVLDKTILDMLNCANVFSFKLSLSEELMIILINTPSPKESEVEFASLIQNYFDMISGLYDGVAEVKNQLVELETLDNEKEKMVTIGELAPFIAHEIKSPLTIMSASAQLLTPDGKGDNAEKILNIQKGIKKIDALVSGILRFSKRAASQRALAKCEVNTVINECVKFLEVLFENSKIEIEYPDKNLYLPIMCDPFKLQQILLNLLMNAKHAVEKNGTDRKIVINTYFDGENVKIRIMDFGPGIPKEFSDKIFDKFFTTKGTSKGTGLGLAISKKLTEEMGGSLTLENPGSKGAVFSISMPKTA